MAGEALVVRQTVVAVKEEADPGVLETLGAADAAFKLFDPTDSPDIEQHDQDSFGADKGSTPALQGKSLNRLGWETHLVGSGDHSSATGSPPPFDVSMRCCGYGRTDNIFAIPIGAITGGTGKFQIDEQVTGDGLLTSADVCMTTLDGMPFLFLYNVVGTVDAAEVITGGTSGAQATASGAVAADEAMMYRPVNTGDPTATVGIFVAGEGTANAHLRRLGGCRGDFVISARTSGAESRIRFDFTGGLNDPENVAMIIPTIPSLLPPQVFNADVTLQENYKAHCETYQIGAGNQISPEPSMNTATGYIETLIERRAGRGSIDPRLVMIDGHDFYARLKSGAVGEFSIRIGSTVGNQFFIQAPNMQYANPSPGSRAGRASLGLDMLCHPIGAGGNDAVIIAY